MTFRAIALSAVLVAIPLAGCSSQAAAPSTPDTGNNRPADTTTSSPAPTASLATTTTSTPSATTSTPSANAAPTPSTPDAPSSTTAASDGTAAFGKSYKWADGLSVTVAPPETFKPGQYSSKDPTAKAYVRMDITIVNGTSKPFKPSLFSATMQSGNTQASTVFDSQANLGGSPSTTLLPGREAKFSLGFGVTDPKDIVFEVRPSFDHVAVIWH